MAQLETDAAVASTTTSGMADPRRKLARSPLGSMRKLRLVASHRTQPEVGDLGLDKQLDVAVRLLEQHAAKLTQAATTIRVGSRVEAVFLVGTEQRWYRGNVTKMHVATRAGRMLGEDDTFDITYDDGDREARVRKTRVRLLAGKARPKVLKRKPLGSSRKMLASRKKKMDATARLGVDALVEGRIDDACRLLGEYTSEAPLPPWFAAAEEAKAKAEKEGAEKEEEEEEEGEEAEAGAGEAKGEAKDDEGAIEKKKKKKKEEEEEEEAGAIEAKGGEDEDEDEDEGENRLPQPPKEPAPPPKDAPTTSTPRDPEAEAMTVEKKKKMREKVVDPRTWRAYGRALYLRWNRDQHFGSLKKAYAVYARAMEGWKGEVRPSVLYELCKVYMAYGAFNEALRLQAQVIEQYQPQLGTARLATLALDAAAVLKMQGDYTSAIQYFAWAEDNHPPGYSRAAVSFQLARCLELDGQLTMSSDAFKTVYRHLKWEQFETMKGMSFEEWYWSPDTWAGMGRAYAAAPVRNHVLAADALYEALRRGKDGYDVTLMLDLARSYYGMNDIKNAMSTALAALKEAPFDVRVKKQLARWDPDKYTSLLRDEDRVVSKLQAAFRGRWGKAAGMRRRKQVEAIQREARAKLRLRRNRQNHAAAKVLTANILRRAARHAQNKLVMKLASAKLFRRALLECFRAWKCFRAMEIFRKRTLGTVVDAWRGWAGPVRRKREHGLRRGLELIGGRSKATCFLCWKIYTARAVKGKALIGRLLGRILPPVLHAWHDFVVRQREKEELAMRRASVRIVKRAMVKSFAVWRNKIRNKKEITRRVMKFMQGTKKDFFERWLDALWESKRSSYFTRRFDRAAEMGGTSKYAKDGSDAPEWLLEAVAKAEKGDLDFRTEARLARRAAKAEKDREHFDKVMRRRARMEAREEARRRAEESGAADWRKPALQLRPHVLEDTVHAGWDSKMHRTRKGVRKPRDSLRWRRVDDHALAKTTLRLGHKRGVPIRSGSRVLLVGAGATAEQRVDPSAFYRAEYDDFLSGHDPSRAVVVATRLVQRTWRRHVFTCKLRAAMARFVPRMIAGVIVAQRHFRGHVARKEARRRAHARAGALLTKIGRGYLGRHRVRRRRKRLHSFWASLVFSHVDAVGAAEHEAAVRALGTLKGSAEESDTMQHPTLRRAAKMALLPRGPSHLGGSSLLRPGQLSEATAERIWGLYPPQRPGAVAAYAPSPREQVMPAIFRGHLPRAPRRNGKRRLPPTRPSSSAGAALVTRDTPWPRQIGLALSPAQFKGPSQLQTRYIANVSRQKKRLLARRLESNAAAATAHLTQEEQWADAVDTDGLLSGPAARAATADATTSPQQMQQQQKQQTDAQARALYADNSGAMSLSGAPLQLGGRRGGRGTDIGLQLTILKLERETMRVRQKRASKLGRSKRRRQQDKMQALMADVTSIATGGGRKGSQRSPRKRLRRRR